MTSARGLIRVDPGAIFTAALHEVAGRTEDWAMAGDVQ